MKLLKAAALFVIGAASIVAFVDLNISRDYPVDDACRTIRAFRSQHGHSPTSDEADAILPNAKLFSVRKYEKRGDDFLFYFCETGLGPCEVCTGKEGPYWDEI